MKKLLLLIAITPVVFMACDNKPEPETGESAASGDATTSSNSAAASTNSQAPSFHNALANVVSNLDTNGSHLSVTHIDEDIMQLAKAVDGLIEVARTTSDDVPPNLSAVNLVNNLGLEKIDAMGRSSRWNDSAWHNRLFIQTGGSRSGVLSIMGDEGTPWRAGEFAPADADMVLEFELNLRRLRMTMMLVSTAFGEEAQQSFAEAMQEKIADGAMTLGDLLGKMDLRATLVMSMDSDKRWSVSEGVELPAMNAALRIERGMWLWKQFGEQIEENAEVSEQDGLKMIKAPEEMDTPMGKLRPVIVLDESKDLIWVSMTEMYLDQCRSGKATLAKSDDFKKASVGFPAKGNGLCYVSGDFCKELVGQVMQMRKNIPKDREASALFDSLLGISNLSVDNVPHGYAWCISNTGTGILVVGNSPMPDKGYGVMSGIAPISAMAAMATPVILKQRKKAQAIQALNNMKQMFYLFIEYDADFGAFPKQLDDLVKEKLVKKETLNMLSSCEVNGGTEPLVYIPGFSTSDNAAIIIMHTPAPVEGKRTCLRIDGSVIMVPESEFQELIKAQKAPE